MVVVNAARIRRADCSLIHVVVPMAELVCAEVIQLVTLTQRYAKGEFVYVSFKIVDNAKNVTETINILRLTSLDLHHIKSGPCIGFNSFKILHSPASTISFLLPY